MSEQYPGGFITRLEPTVNGSVARGMWTLSQAAGYRRQGLWPTSPGAPTIGTATAGAGSASVAFTPPANTGSTAITSYTVTSNPGGFTASGASSPITVTGLTVGTSYTFTVTATNGAGTSPASAASNSVTPFAPNYIEDVFSTFLYTGNGSSQTITNGINLSGQGGLVWTKCRNDGVLTHRLNDTVRGITNRLFSNLTNDQSASATSITAVSSTGYTVGSENGFNQSSNTFVSWTFREQPKFFDIVAYTGDGAATRAITHSLTSVPGCVIVKRLDQSASWKTTVKDATGNFGYILQLNTTDSGGNSNTTAGGYILDDSFTSTTFTVTSHAGSNAAVNAAGGSYVAYVFAHNAGGFGSTGNDNVISCGRLTTNSSSVATVDLGYEPQWLLVKNASADGNNWFIWDIMRGWTTDGMAGDFYLIPNSSAAEGGGADYGGPSATGFTLRNLQASNAFVYIAIRRGPMRAPTSGTSVFTPVARTGAGGSTVNISTGFPPDIAFNLQRTVTTGEPRVLFGGKLLGGGRFETNSTNAFNDTGYPSTSDVVEYGQSNLTLGTNWVTSGRTYVNHVLRRAPGFFDEVCYTGDGASLSHNLGVVPELIIAKARGTTGSWRVTSSATTGVLYLDATDAKNGTDSFQTLTPCTATTMNLSGISQNTTNVAYLFASCPGVSKVGSYTGTGSTQTINCGFTGGARYVLIKRTDSTGNWFVWDTARGMVSGTDPRIPLNATTAESNADWVLTTPVGFQIVTSDANVNASGGTYIFLAIA